MGYRLTAFADEISDRLSTQIELLKTLGIAYVEYRSGEGKNVSDHTLAEAREVMERFQDQGIGISSLGSPIGKMDIEEDFSPHLELFKHTLDVAETMRAPYIRLFSFFIPQGKDPADYRDRVIDQMGAFVQAAQGRKVTLLHENEKEIYGDMPERCLDILSSVNSPMLRAAYDFSNFVQCGCDNLAAWPLLREYVVYFHLKDSVYTHEGVRRDLGRQVTGNAHRPLGQGDGHCLEILRDAYQAGFDGFASIEPHLGEEYGAQGTERFTAAARAAQGLLNQIEA